MKKFAVGLVVLALSACGGGDSDDAPVPGSLEAVLEGNTTWPYEAQGVLDIVEAGFEDSEYAHWAVGFLITDPGDEFGIMIEITDGVAERAKIDIDSGREVRVWLEKPKTEYGELTYPVSRIEAL